MHANSKNRQWLLLASLLLLLAGATYWYMTDDSLKQRKLADGTEVFYFRGSSFDTASDYPATREIQVDGDLFFRAAESTQPLTLRTKLLVVTVTGASAFRVTAFSDKNGERIDVLYGNVHTEKNYESVMKEPVDMVGGQMMMINVTIDFVEKETLHDDEVPEWIMQVEPGGIQREPIN